MSDATQSCHGDLFVHMSNTHDLTLTDSEMDDIEHIVNANHYAEMGKLVRDNMRLRDIVKRAMECYWDDSTPASDMLKVLDEVEKTP